MRRVAFVLAVAFCASAWLTLSSCAEPPEPAATADQSTESGGEAQPSPEDLLRQMADYLGNLPAVSCRVESAIHIQAKGMDNRMATKMTARLERPNRLALVVDEGAMGMTVVSDGKELTQYVPMMKRYAVTDAPADFSGFTDSGGATGIAMLGVSGAVIPTNGEEFYNKLTDGVTGSEYVGTEKVGDVLCHRCRFHGEDFNWDIWIEVGDRPLVHKVVPDFSKQLAEAEGMLEDAKLEYSVVFSDWNVAPQFTDADFAFNPPADAEKVDSLFEGLAGGEVEGPHPLLGQPAPPFATVDPKDQAIDLNKHLGQSVILLDFWATWCGPCVQAMPEVDKVAQKFAPQGLVFYAVNVGEDAATISEFLKTRELEVPVALDPEGKISELYRVEGIPQTVLVGKDGKVQVVHVGFSPSLGDELTKEVEDLLAGKDLATDALAKAEEAKKKRAAAKKHVESAGVTPAWSIPGRWNGVFAMSSGDKVYAASAGKGVAAVDASGEIKQEIATKSGGTLRLANLVGDGAPEIVLFEAWRSGVKAISATGEPLWEYPPGDGVDDVWAADINGDGLDEVIVGFNGGTGLHVLDNRGTPLWKFAEIGNVWHVTAGDFNQDGRVDVVITSARGDVHVFDTEGKKLKDIDVSIYGNMVRMATLGDGSRLAIVTGTGDRGESLVGVNFVGEEKFAVALPNAGVDHVDDMAIAASVQWAAVAMRGGLVNVVDLDSARVIARVADQGSTPHVTWLPRKDQTPLLVVATGKDLNAFEVTPTDLDAGDEAEAPDETSGDVATPAEVPAGATEAATAE